MFEDRKTDEGRRRGPSDSADYSSTQAPETREEAEERHPHPSDPRLQPGGPHGSRVDPGMSSLDRDVTPHGGRNPGFSDYGSTPDETDD